MMTARFLLHLRDWEHQATSETVMTGGGGKPTVLRFKKTTENEDDLGWTIHDEFGYDPVLEARENTRKLTVREVSSSSSNAVAMDELSIRSEREVS